MQTVKTTAKELVARFDTNDPFVICSLLDIEVLEVELPAGVRGFYACLMGAQIIYLNASIEDERERRVVCAHELGHALLHRKHNSLFLKERTNFVAARFEREADLFSGYLLLDDDTAYDCRCNGWTSVQISRFTGLSESVVEYCLTN